MNEHVQTATTEPLFNSLSPEFIRDPYPSYARLRVTDPMHLTPFGTFAASRHAEVSLVLRDKRFGKDYVERTVRRYGPQIMEEPVFRSMSHWMLQQDPPDHTRLRGLVVKAFTARRVDDMRPRIQEIVDQSIDDVKDRGQMDFLQLFELRRREPGDDLTTQLVQAEEDGNKLTNEELTANIILLFGAGHETTVNLIGNGLLALYRNPDQLALLKANPSLMPNAVEEFLRYDSSVQLTGRVALEDIDDLGGKKIPKGETVLCLLGSANRDPAAYPDHPDRLDITRANVRPLSFGGGIHHCLGAQLARIEAEIALATLLRRLPDLRLDDAVNPEWRPTFVLRGLRRLPASW